MAIRERMTKKTANQSQNNYDRNKALQIVQNLLSETEKELKNWAATIDSQDAQEVGAGSAAPVEAVEEAAAEDTVVEEAAGELDDIVEEEQTKMASRKTMVFEPKKRQASEKVFTPKKREAAEKVFEPKSRKASEVQPGVEDSIGQNKWFEVKEAFPTKTRGMKMLDLAPGSKSNAQAISVMARKLDRVANALQGEDQKDLALQLDLISECLESSL